LCDCRVLSSSFGALSYLTYALFAWLISHQPAVLFSHNKSATNNQPAVLFSQNKPAPAISHQPNEEAVSSLFIPWPLLYSYNSIWIQFIELVSCVFFFSPNYTVQRRYPHVHNARTLTSMNAHTQTLPLGASLKTRSSTSSRLTKSPHTPRYQREGRLPLKAQLRYILRNSLTRDVRAIFSSTYMVWFGFQS
jgi:hypothetical protein